MQGWLFLSGKELVHLTGLKRRSWKPTPWCMQTSWTSMGTLVIAYIQYINSRWRSRSPTASRQSRTVPRTISVHRNFPLGRFVGVSYVAPYGIVLAILLMLWCLQMVVRLGYYEMPVQMRIHSCRQNQFQKGLSPSKHKAIIAKFLFSPYPWAVSGRIDILILLFTLCMSMPKKL